MERFAAVDAALMIALNESSSASSFILFIRQVWRVLQQLKLLS